jgi:hypothetical protein
MEEPTRAEVLSLFERHRRNPTAEFDESHFLDFLVTAPSSRGAIHNSFSGLRRLNRFWNEIQLTWGVHFSMKDWERTWALDPFVERLRSLRRSPRSSLMSLASQRRVGFGFGPALLVNVALIGGAFATSSGSTLREIAYTALFLVDGACLLWWLRYRRYYNRLEKRIRELHSEEVVGEGASEP